MSAPASRSASASPASNVSGGKPKSRNEPSRQSGRVTFPQSLKSDSSSIVAYSDPDEMSPNINPFVMPPENDIFMLRDKEKQRKKQERVKQRSLKVSEKMTYATRVNSKSRAIIKPTGSDDEYEKDEEPSDKAVAVKDDPSFTLAVTRDRHVEKESLTDYIAKKREMFLVQYSLGVKRDEMRKLEEIAQAEERKLELAEQYLEEDAAMFDEFLHENDKNSVDAIRVAEAETKAKLEKVTEIKKINAQIMLIKSEISKNEDLLKEYQLYKKFLDALTPEEWRDKKKSLAKKKEESGRIISSAKSKDGSLDSVPSSARGSTGGVKTPKKQGSAKKAGKSGTPTQDTATADENEDLDLYFSDPQQLLDIFQELEEQNLSLIQNSQETEETLEEMKQTIQQTQDKMDKETNILKQQIDMLNGAIKREEEKASDLEIKSKMFSYGEFKSEDQEAMLAALNGKVEEVYRNCIGDNEANISTLQMLTNIENRLEELFEQIEMMPPEKVEAAEKAKEKERRLRMRAEKMEAQKLHQEERVKKALERAQAAPRKQTGRKLMYRSEPPQTKRKVDEEESKRDREEEELAYFFS